MPRTVAPVVPAGSMSSVRQPTLTVDDDLVLRPFRFDDLDEVLAAFEDPAIVKWHSRRLDSRLEAREWIGYHHQLWLRETCATFAIAGPDDRVVGRVALYTDFQAGTGEIAYWVLPDHRGNGVAARAGRVLTRWGHDHLGLVRICLEHAVDNHASCAVAEALGYALEGTARGLHALADGRHDVHVHAHLDGD